MLKGLGARAGAEVEEVGLDRDPAPLLLLLGGEGRGAGRGHPGGAWGRAALAGLAAFSPAPLLVLVPVFLEPPLPLVRGQDPAGLHPHGQAALVAAPLAVPASLETDGALVGSPALVRAVRVVLDGAPAGGRAHFTAVYSRLST